MVWKKTRQTNGQALDFSQSMLRITQCYSQRKTVSLVLRKSGIQGINSSGVSRVHYKPSLTSLANPFHLPPRPSCSEWFRGSILLIRHDGCPALSVARTIPAPALEMRREHRFVRVLRGWLTLWKSKILWISSEPSPSEIIPRNDWGGRHFAENVDKPSSRCLWAVIQRKFEKGTTSAFSSFRAPFCPSLSSILCSPFPTST